MALSDEAKKKRLEKRVAKTQKRIRQGKKKAPPILSDRKKIDLIQRRAAKLYAKAKDVERSKTGNVKAAATYRQAAKEMLERIPASMRRKK